MKLIIDKLAKVFHAELDFDGITVITGANNTGKSTIGKSLLAMFSAFSGIDGRVRDGREAKYRELLSDYEDRFTEDGLAHSSYELAEDLVSGRVDLDGLRDILMESHDDDREAPDVDEWIYRFKEIAALSDEDIKCQEVLNTLSSVFNSQCGSLYYPTTHPTFELLIKNKKLSAELTSKLPKCTFGVNLKHSAFYIDSPETLVDIGKSLNMRFSRPWHSSASRLSRSLVQRTHDGFVARKEGTSKAVDDLLVKSKFVLIESRLKQLMGGSLRLLKDQGLVFVDDAIPGNAIKIQNLSQGIKAMALLQAAFMNGTIADYDVLILDEPEIHLHPKWQIRYAEFIVLLQKVFNLTVLLTSHSPDFVEAIRLYTKKHGIVGRLNCYVSRVMANGAVTMDSVLDESWDDVFDSFGTSFDELMKLRLELEGK